MWSFSCLINFPFLGGIMSMFRINHNISSLNTQTQLNRTQGAQSKNLERLSSGMKINKAADGPASLAISERMRSLIAGLEQAVDNSETGISMVQTAEGAMNEISRLLVKARQLSIHAANEGVNDRTMLEADQQELANVLDSVDRIAATTQFGTKNLIDGSRGANGVATGENLEFVGATERTRTSPVEGYKVRITDVATRSSLQGSVGLTQEIIDAEESITINEGGKTLNFTTSAGESIESTLNELEREINRVGLNIDLIRNEQNIVQFRSKEYGSEHSFSAASSTAGIIGQQANVSVESLRGNDVSGTINGEEAIGRGQILTGKKGTQNVEGLSIRYTGTKPNEEGEFAGSVTAFQNSLVFHIGSNADQTTSISLKNLSTNALSTGVTNESNFTSLRELDVRDFRGAEDSIILLDEAIKDVAATRANLGAFQTNNLESNLNSLRNAHENLTNAESVVRDTDMAKEMADFTKNQILVQSGTAMLAQANQTPQTVLSLLG